MTTAHDDVLDVLQPASPRQLLDELARLGRALAKADRPRPEVELFLTSGQAVKGRIVAVADDRQGAVALIQVGGSARAPAVTFVRLDHVAALTVGDASLLVKAPTADAPVPSKLELARQAAARGDALAGAVGRPLAIQLGGASELDDDGRRAIGVAMPLVVDVLTAIAGDEMGREALRAIDTIELGAAGSGEVRVDGKRLIVRAPKLLTEQFTHQTLRRQIEKLL
ncbi:MAG TPA: hypothetical protein VFQ53_02080 [Kofleriaceae bacterium]|nr:hypothetical protein [Kofleriaceae bacterium]